MLLRIFNDKYELGGAAAEQAATAIRKAIAEHDWARPGYSPNGYTNGACAAIGILPTDFRSMQAYKAAEPIDPYPVDVNPRPTQSPGTPTSGTWIP